MAADLTGLVRRPAFTPQVYRCACGCGAYASRGLPKDVWYAPSCLPPHLRRAHEPEYRPLTDPGAPIAAPPPAGSSLRAPDPASETGAPDLLTGLVPA